MEKLDNASLGYVFGVRGVKPRSHYLWLWMEKWLQF